MAIGELIYRALHYVFPGTFPDNSPTAAEVEEEANQACFQDIYSEPCARLSDLSEQKGGLNIRKEAMKWDAKIRPMLERAFAKHSQSGETCTQIEENTCSIEANSTPFPGSLASPADFIPNLSCYEMLVCSEVPNFFGDDSIKIFLTPGTTQNNSL